MSGFLTAAFKMAQAAALSVQMFVSTPADDNKQYLVQEPYQPGTVELVKAHSHSNQIEVFDFQTTSSDPVDISDEFRVWALNTFGEDKRLVVNFTTDESFYTGARQDLQNLIDGIAQSGQDIEIVNFNTTRFPAYQQMMERDGFPIGHTVDTGAFAGEVGENLRESYKATLIGPITPNDVADFVTEEPIGLPADAPGVKAKEYGEKGHSHFYWRDGVSHNGEHSHPDGIEEPHSHRHDGPNFLKP